MSQYEYHVGRAIEVAINSKGLLEKAKYVKLITNDDILYKWDVPEDELECNYSNYVYIKKTDQLFFIEERVEDDDGVCVARKFTGSDGLTRYDFTLTWHNGGAGFDEVFESAILSAKETLK